MHNKEKSLSAGEVQVAKVQNLANGGARITLDLPETSIDVAAKLLQISMSSRPLVYAVFLEDLNETNSIS